MTITDFTNKQEFANRTLKEAQELPESLTGVIKLLQDAKIPNDTINAVRDKINTAIIINSHTISQLQELTWLLDTIARETKMPWPPACIYEKGD